MQVIEERRIRLIDTSPRVLEISDNSDDEEDEEDDSRDQFEIESLE